MFQDPILTAFELSWELRQLAFAEYEFKSEYLVQSLIIIDPEGTPPEKKMFSFGHCPNEGGGEALARIKKYNIYIYL